MTQEPADVAPRGGRQRCGRPRRDSGDAARRFPLFGPPASLGEMRGIGSAFTVVSLARC